MSSSLNLSDLDLSDLEEVVIGIIYPTAWFGDPREFAAVIERLEALDERIRVLTEPYEETSDRRAERGAEPDFDWIGNQPPLTDDQLALFARANILMGIDFPAAITELAPNLRWVQGIGAGADQIVSCRLPENGIVLTNSSGANSVGIAEFAMGRIIEATKKFPALAEHQRQQKWKPEFGVEMAGLTLGLIGYGAINQAVARRAKAFDMRVLTTRRSPGGEPDIDATFTPDQLHEMLGQCNYVISAVPDSPQTRQMMNAEAFAAMMAGSFFVNVGRGTLVDETALVAAVESGHLSGAALDVASQEPLPAGHPLWSTPGVVLSYHCSASPNAMFPRVHQMFEQRVATVLA